MEENKVEAEKKKKRQQNNQKMVGISGRIHSAGSPELTGQLGVVKII